MIYIIYIYIYIIGSLGLVLSILLPDLGAKAYLLTLLSPYAGMNNIHIIYIILC